MSALGDVLAIMVTEAELIMKNSSPALFYAFARNYSHTAQTPAQGRTKRFPDTMERSSNLTQPPSALASLAVDPLIANISDPTKDEDTSFLLIARVGSVCISVVTIQSNVAAAEPIAVAERFL